MTAKYFKNMFNSFFNIFTLHTTITVAFGIRLDPIHGVDDTAYNYKNKFRENHESASLYNSSIELVDHWFTQKLDHFTPTTFAKWKQRFFVNDIFYEPGGPVFLFIYGETEATTTWMRAGQWLTYAKRVDAMCFGLEHRYYGESRPFGNTTVENLIYLNAKQVLADIANFIETMNIRHNFSPNTKWILFGGSYAGSLAAWARMRYPHLIYSAIASSAPLLAKADFSEYFQVVKNALNSINANCAENIIKANEELKLIANNKSRKINISSLFQLCAPLTHNDEDITAMFEILGDSLAYATQYNSVIFSINDVCSIMDDGNLPLLKRYGILIAKFLKALQENCLTSSYSRLIEQYKSIDYKSSQSGRLWYYQTCTEFGYFLTSTKKTDLFGDLFPLEYYLKKCKDIFGPSFYDKSSLIQSIDRTNREFGGLEYNSSNVIFVYGSLDPWHALGAMKKIKNVPYEVIYVNGTAHCSDMYSSSDTDPPQLKAARSKIFEKLVSWLSDGISSRRGGRPYHPKCIF